jgi:two-component system chemotaxis response regulator CheY
MCPNRCSTHLDVEQKAKQHKKDTALKVLIVEDDFISRVLLQELLAAYGQSHIAVNGKEALEAVRSALDAFEPYDLICMDIMMPEMDGQQALKEIRALEAARGIKRGAKILMTTALVDQENVMEALKEKCDGFLAKPIRKALLLGHLRKLGVIP